VLPPEGPGPRISKYDQCNLVSSPIRMTGMEKMANALASAAQMRHENVMSMLKTAAFRARSLHTTLIMAMAALSAGPALAQPGGFTLMETGRTYGQIADAIAAIGDGQGTIVAAPGTYKQCAIQEGGNIVLRAASPGTVIFSGRVCEEKAALVLRGRSMTIDGIVFQRMGVRDGNGAGIRLEQGDLTVANSLFRDSEQGILTGNSEGGTIRIDRSTFSRLGRCDRDLDCAHSIYIGHYGMLTVTRSRFEAGNGGHYVKSRSKRVALVDNSFDDSAGRTTNYMIDLPSGSTGRVTGNVMVQGRDKENYSAFIAVAAEGTDNSSDGLQISGNSAAFVPGLTRGSTFVADWSGDKLAIGENRMATGIKRFEKR
jgi:Right handed beta helix region